MVANFTSPGRTGFRVLQFLFRNKGDRAVKLFAVMYLKNHLAMAMFLWPGADMQDCQKINAKYESELPSTPGIKSGQVKLSDVRLACEWHKQSPIKN